MDKTAPAHDYHETQQAQQLQQRAIKWYELSSDEIIFERFV